MHVIILFIISLSLGVFTHYLSPIFENIFSVHEKISAIDIKKIEMKVTELQKLNEKLRSELLLTNEELSKQKRFIADLTDENSQLKNKLAEQIEKDKKNISLLFN